MQRRRQSHDIDQSPNSGSLSDFELNSRNTTPVSSRTSSPKKRKNSDSKGLIEPKALSLSTSPMLQSQTQAPARTLLTLLRDSFDQPLSDDKHATTVSRTTIFNREPDGDALDLTYFRRGDKLLRTENLPELVLFLDSHRHIRTVYLSNNLIDDEGADYLLRQHTLNVQSIIAPYNKLSPKNEALLRNIGEKNHQWSEQQIIGTRNILTENNFLISDLAKLVTHFVTYNYPGGISTHLEQNKKIIQWQPTLFHRAPVSSPKPNNFSILVNNKDLTLKFNSDITQDQINALAIHLTKKLRTYGNINTIIMIKSGKQVFKIENIPLEKLALILKNTSSPIKKPCQPILRKTF